jgi:hypothetical protein
MLHTRAGNELVSVQYVLSEGSTATASTQSTRACAHTGVQLVCELTKTHSVLLLLLQQRSLTARQRVLCAL